MHLLEFMDGLLGPNSTRQLAHLFQATPRQITRAASAAMPVVLGGLIQSVERRPAEDVPSLLQRNDPAVLDDLRWLADPREAQAWIDRGRAELHDMWRERSAPLLEQVALSSGMRREQGDRVIGLLASVVLAFMSRQLTSRLGLSGVQAQQFLTSQRDTLTRSAPESLLKAMGWLDTPAELQTESEAGEQEPGLADASPSSPEHVEAILDLETDQHLPAPSAPEPQVAFEVSGEFDAQAHALEAETHSSGIATEGIATEAAPQVVDDSKAVEDSIASADDISAEKQAPQETAADLSWRGSRVASLDAHRGSWRRWAVAVAVLAGLAGLAYGVGPKWLASLLPARQAEAPGVESSAPADDTLGELAQAPLGDSTLAVSLPSQPATEATAEQSSTTSDISSEEPPEMIVVEETPGATWAAGVTRAEPQREASQQTSLSAKTPLALFDSAASRLLDSLATVVDSTSAELAAQGIHEAATSLEELVRDSASFRLQDRLELASRVSAIKQRLDREVVPRMRSIPGAGETLLAPLRRIATALNALQQPGS